LKIKAIVFDVDGVLTEIDSVWQYIHKNLGTSEQAKINAIMFKKGLIDYAEWARRDVSLWKGLSFQKIKEIIAAIPVRAGAEELFHYLKKVKNLKIIALSAGLEIVIEHLKETLEIDYHLANILVTKNGVITGAVEVLVGYNDKGSVMSKLCEKAGIKTNECIAVGDSEVDVPMFKVASIGIAFNPKDEITAKSADVIVNSNNLKSLIPVIDSLL